MGANADLVRRFIEEVQVKGDGAAYEAMVAPHFRNHHLLAGRDRPFDRAEFGARFGAMIEAFSDLRVEIHAMTEDGDKVWTHKTVSGVHSGALNGLAPTGKAVAFSVMDIIRVADGQIVEHWAVADQFTLLKQLGVA